jgi:hydroxyacylglutathione hydrolase
MGLQIERVPTLGDNYTYVIVCDETREAAIVDAPEFDPVVARVKALDVRVTKVLSTHHHPDHSAANPQLAKQYGVPVYGHVSDANRLPGFTDGLEEGDTISVGRQTATVLFIPAHTSGHIAYYFEAAGVAFTGDTLFAGGCGRLFEGTPEMMFTALHDKLGALPDDVEIYCGHEYTESNLAFAEVSDPDNDAVKQRLARVREIRTGAAGNWHDATPAEMTIPSTMADERGTNPFVRATDAEDLGRIRSHKDNF